MAKITQDLSHVLRALRVGHCVAIPTETVYGLAAWIHSESAIRNVFLIKGRPSFDPLIVHVDSLEMAEPLAHWNGIARSLARRFWPGPLTLVLKKTSQVSDIITSGLPTVGIRCPAHELTQKLLQELGEPLAAPSANRFQKTSPTTSEHVLSEFPNEPLLILEGGPASIGVESTILEVVSEDVVRLLRPGGLSRETIQESFPTIHIESFSQARITAPGQMENHYQPDTPLYLIKDRTTVIDRDWMELKLPRSPQMAARLLYQEMRRLSALHPTGLYFVVEPYQDGDLWAAIRDRLQKASQKSAPAPSIERRDPVAAPPV